MQGNPTEINASVEALGMRHRTMPANPAEQVSRPSNGYDFSGALPAQPCCEKIKCVNMLLDFELAAIQNRPIIWCMAACSDLIAIGMASGSVELYRLGSGLFLCQYVKSTVGATQICLRGSRVVVARLNGQLDFLELRFVPNAQLVNQSVMQGPSSGSAGNSGQEGIFHCRLLNSLTGHQHPINCMKTTTRYVVTASDDHTLKVFDLHTCRCVFVLYGHNAPVTDFIIDHDVQYLYSTCTDGLICVWDLQDGNLVKTLLEVSYSNGPPVALALTTTMIVGHTHDGSIWLWKKSGELVTRIKPDFGYDTSPHVNTSALVVLSDKLAVSSYLNSIRFWDLQYKVMLKETKLEEDNSHIRSFIKLDELSVACCKGTYVYKVTFPFIKVSSN